MVEHAAQQHIWHAARCKMLLQPARGVHQLCLRLTAGLAPSQGASRLYVASSIGD